MQDNVDIYTTALIRVLQDSDEYRAFMRAKKALLGKTELKKQINDYRMEVYCMQNYGDAGQLLEQMQEFQKKHEKFRSNPLVNNYLHTELAVCRLLQRVTARVAEEIDLELDEVAQVVRY